MLTIPPPPNVEAIASHLFARLTSEFPSLEELYHVLTTTDPELRKLADSPELVAKIELTLKLAQLRFQILTAQAIDAGITALMKILESDKPETIRRAANTLLQITGILPTKQPAPKPWEKPPQNPTPENDITKQHLPTYSDLPTPNPTHSAGCHAQWGRGPAGHALQEDFQSTTPTSQPPQPISEFSLQNSALKTNITNIHGPTYSNSSAGTPASRRPEAAETLSPPSTPQRHSHLPTPKSSITKPHLPTYAQLATQALAHPSPQNSPCV